jgi:hypothetical protein
MENIMIRKSTKGPINLDTGPKPLTTSTKFSEIDAALKSLKNNKLYRISDLVATIRQISNLHTSTLRDIQNPIPYTDLNNLESIDDLYVDMTYQRKMRLRKLLKKLTTKGMFDKDAAGFVDIAVRTDAENTKVIWDGFRRVIMAALAGYDQIPCSKTWHQSHIPLSEQPKREARLFKIRNTPEKMSPEEMFKADVVYEEPRALELKQLLEDCNLEVDDIIDKGGRPLGGIAEVDSNFKTWKLNPDNFTWDRKHWISASKMLQAIYPKKLHPQISTYVLRDLAWLLTVNDNLDNDEGEYTEQDIQEAWSKWVSETDENGSPLHNKQTDITTAGSKKKTITSWWIAKNILQDNNGLSEKLYEYIPSIIKTTNSVITKGLDDEGYEDESDQS